MNSNEKVEHAAALYFEAPRLPKRVLYIHPIQAYALHISGLFKKHQEELNLKDDDMEYIVSWIFIEQLKNALQENNVKVIGHQRCDEAKALMSNEMPGGYVMTLMKANFYKRFKHLRDTDIKAFISGDEMIVAARYEP